MYVMLVYAVALPRQSCLPRGGVLGTFYLPDHETPGAALRHLAAPGYDRSAEPEAQGTPRGRPKAFGSVKNLHRARSDKASAQRRSLKIRN